MSNLFVSNIKMEAQLENYISNYISAMLKCRYVIYYKGENSVFSMPELFAK